MLQIEKLMHFVAASSIKLNQLIAAHGFQGLEVSEFLKNFKAALALLDKQVSMTVLPTNNASATGPSSLSLL
jgi:hypothetical protein